MLRSMARARFAMRRRHWLKCTTCASVRRSKEPAEEDEEDEEDEEGPLSRSPELLDDAMPSAPPPAASYTRGGRTDDGLAFSPPTGGASSMTSAMAYACGSTGRAQCLQQLKIQEENE